MYCRKCGKYVVGNKDICDECANVENNAYATEPETVIVNEVETDAPETVIVNETANASAAGSVPVYSGSKTKGIAIGIVGVVIAIVAAIVVGVGYGIAVVGAEMLEGPDDVALVKSMLEIGMVICYVGMAVAIPSFVLGPIAIKTFVSHNKATGVKAIPTLVLGIISLAEALGVVLTALSYAGEIALVISQLV